jgi:hypothetical protein
MARRLSVVSVVCSLSRAGVAGQTPSASNDRLDKWFYRGETRGDDANVELNAVEHVSSMLRVEENGSTYQFHIRNLGSLSQGTRVSFERD